MICHSRYSIRCAVSLACCSENITFLQLNAAIADLYVLPSRSLFHLRSLDCSLLLRSFAFTYLFSTQLLRRSIHSGDPLLTMSRPPSAPSSAPGTPTPRTAASGGTTPIHTIVQNLPNLFQMYEKGTLSDTQVTQVGYI